MQQEAITSQAIETRLDVRDIATLYKFYALNDFHPSSKSALLREAFSDLCRILVSNDLAKKFASSTEAIDYLDSVGFNFNKRSINVLSLQIDQETIVASSHEDATVTPDEVRKAVEMMKTTKESK